MSDWQTPTGGGILAVLLALWGRLAYVRRKNSDAVKDAEDSTSASYVGQLHENWQAAEKLAKTNYGMYVAELRRADGLQGEVNELKKDLADFRRQIERLTNIVIADHPEFKEVLRRTGFGELPP